MRHPIDNPVLGSAFGPRKAPVPGASTFHQAQDYKASKGTPVHAIADGVVSSSFWTGPGGWWIQIRRPNGDVFGGCHLREKSPLKVGTRVSEGDVIARVGNTGTATSGPHLHFMVVVGGVAVDPVDYIESHSLNQPTAPSNPTTPAPAPEEEDDPMNHLRGVQLADKRLIVQNLADHTYYDVPSTTQWKYLKDLGLRLVSGAQDLQVIAGFRKI